MYVVEIFDILPILFKFILNRIVIRSKLEIMRIDIRKRDDSIFSSGLISEYIKKYFLPRESLTYENISVIFCRNISVISAISVNRNTFSTYSQTISLSGVAKCSRCAVTVVATK